MDENNKPKLQFKVGGSLAQRGQLGFVVLDVGDVVVGAVVGVVARAGRAGLVGRAAHGGFQVL